MLCVDSLSKIPAVYPLSNLLAVDANRRAASLTLLAVLVYYALAVLVFVGVYTYVELIYSMHAHCPALTHYICVPRYWGYSVQQWDSSLIHSTAPLLTFAMMGLLPPFALQILVNDGFIHSSVFKTNIWNPLEIVALATSTDRIVHDKEGITEAGVVMLVLCKYYFCFWSAVTVALLWVAQSPSCLLLPVLLTQNWITPLSWVWRFRVLTLQFMTLPLLVGSWIELKRCDSLLNGCFSTASSQRLLLRLSQLLLTVARAQKLPSRLRLRVLQLLAGRALCSRGEQMEAPPRAGAAV